MTDQARQAAAQDLVSATIELAQSGKSLMERVAPPGGAFVVWEHYPPDDAVDRNSGCRWFYHAHPLGERAKGENQHPEHGHFHVFFDKRRFARSSARAIAGPPDGQSSGADVVHIIAISIDINGLPTRLFTVNRWVTDEWLYPSTDILRRLPKFDLVGAKADPLVNRWLSAAIHFYDDEIAAALQTRDQLLADHIGIPGLFEDRAIEILSQIEIDINDAARMI